MSYEAEWRARFGVAAEPEPEIPDLPWLRQVLMRRTHRRYAERPVPEPLLRLLLGTALSASSKSDFQQASVIRVRDRQSRDRLAALVPDMPWVGNAPVFLVFCGDAYRLERIGELRGHGNENGRLEGFFNAAIDAAAGLADLHPGCRNRGSRVLSDQRHPQSRRRGRRHIGSAGEGLPGSGTVRRLPRRRRPRQHAPSARGERAHGPL